MAMHAGLQSLLDRADELLTELEVEYQKCLHTANVTTRALNITHEVLIKLRSALDHAMRKAWEAYVAPNLSPADRERAHVYFPITSDPHSFRATLGRGRMADLGKACNKLYDFLLERQPFSTDDNRWLDLLRQMAVEGKHIRLTPQKRIETPRITVSGGAAGSVSWDPSSVKFGRGVRIMGVPVDPNTQRIVPDPDVQERREIWVSFTMDGYGVDALAFCKEACRNTRTLIEEMAEGFHL